METTNQAFMAPDEADLDLRRGPWTVEEDMLLANYIAMHGEGRWNSLARSAGLKRTGKSCRLRWLNYLRPDVRRGNLTAEEQLLILELHSRWGNRWSKIAQYLPGRTDNEIKNYWRTRVQKHARQLQCDVNSKQFRDLMRYLWMPRLVEKIQASSAASSAEYTSVGGDQFHQYHPQMPTSGVASPENCTSTTNECSSISGTSIPAKLCSQAASIPMCMASTSGIAGDWVAGLEGVETILHPGSVPVTEMVSEPFLNDYGFWQGQGFSSVDTGYEGTVAAAEMVAGSIWNMDNDFWSTQGFQQNYCF